MSFKEELDLMIRSRFTLICIRSYEEERIIDNIRDLCRESNRKGLIWDHADFFQKLSDDSRFPPKVSDPFKLLEEIDRMEGDLLFVLRDFHQCWENQPRIIRKLRTLSHSLKYAKKSIIIVTPTSIIPDELKDDLVVLDFPLPDQDDLKKILDELLKVPDARSRILPEESEKMFNASLGLSSNQAHRIFSKAIVSHGILDIRDIDMIKAEKKSIIRQSNALQLYLPSDTIADVGGLDMIKKWLRMRERAFTKEAKNYGLPAPKGIALMGIPGTGKSLTAKMVANLWNLALIRLDIGALFGSYIGQSEENTRRALQLAETVAPCIIWIDEIEKALSIGDGDGGTSMRVFGNILSWMQDKTAPVFIVATANDITRLPPELLRRGRFDEIFFLDLPTRTERKEIFSVHLRKRNRNPEDFVVDRLADASVGYVGAEIEQAVIEGMYIAYNDAETPGREFTTEDILTALEKLIPMSKSQRENIQALRLWLTEGRAQSASLSEDESGKEQDKEPVGPGKEEQKSPEDEDIPA